MKIHNVAPNMQNINSTNKKKVAFSGSFSKGLTNASEKFFNLSRIGSMTEHLFTANAFVFLLGGRLISSRDKNEKRETLTRDIPTILLAVYGVPLVEKVVARFIQNKKGFVIGEKQGKYGFNVSTFDNLDGLYKYDQNLETSTGIDGHLKRFDKFGGNIKKICSELNDGIKTKLGNFSENNTDFMKKLSTDETLQKEIKKAFSAAEGNKALDKARKLKAMPKLIGFVLTLASIGIFIPRLNIHITEKINKNRIPKENQENSNKPKSV